LIRTDHERGRVDMNFRQLDLNLLVALDALLAERNITEAGKRLHLTQSAMSGALARLREYFGDELLVQVGRKMVPTLLAESLAEPVRGILLQIKAAIDSRPGFEPAASSRRFSLMMSDYVSTVLMNETLQRVAAVAPKISFEIFSNDNPDPAEALERGDIDLLIMPRDYLAEGQPSEPLFSDDYACVVWTGNKSVGERISSEEYSHLGHVCVRLGGGRSPMIDEWFLGRMDITRRIEVLAMNFNSLVQCVVGTNRIATIHRRLALYYCQYLPLRISPCPFELPVITEAMQWHRSFNEDAGLAWLRGKLKEAATAVAPAANS